MAREEGKNMDATTPCSWPIQSDGHRTISAEFWRTFHAALTSLGTQATSILGIGSNLENSQRVQGRLIDGAAAGSYDAAKNACICRVRDVVRECERNNERFTDPEFDIKSDFYHCAWERDFLRGFQKPDSDELRRLDQQPRSVRRAVDILGKPAFAPYSANTYNLDDSPPAWWRKLGWCFTRIQLSLYNFTLLLLFAAILWCCNSHFRTIAAAIGCSLWLVLLLFRSQRMSRRPNFTSSEIIQGHGGHCWFLAAVASVCNRNDLLREICVAWDQPCGVYGFVFYRDGAWTYTVVDDYLYLGNGDLEEELISGKREKHRKSLRKGSSPLHFARCRDSNLSWLPFLEKAFAKIHGDYGALSSGRAEEGLEDLTGGVGSTIGIDVMMGEDSLWDEMVNNSKKEYLYALSSQDIKIDGIVDNHSYAIERAELYFDPFTRHYYRLLRIRNPWGSRKGLWKGAFTDGGKQMSSVASWWLRRFRKDGAFYMTLPDALRTFKRVRRARIFDGTWTTRQIWAKLIVDRTPSYNNVFYLLTLHRESEVVFSLSQLDTRYFRGLEGRHVFQLEFLVRLEHSPPGEYVAHVAVPIKHKQSPRRSVSLEKTLPAGTYEILVKVIAFNRKKNKMWSAEDMARQSRNRPKKLQQITENRDAAYGKLMDPIPTRALRQTGESKCDADDAVCGVGLRVFSQDMEMRLELRDRGPLWKRMTPG